MKPTRRTLRLLLVLSTLVLLSYLPGNRATEAQDWTRNTDLPLSVFAQEAYIKASNTGGYDGFGRPVAISGDTMVIGATGERSSATGVDGDQSDNSLSTAGAAYVFVRDGDTWVQQAYLKASNTDAYDWFGSSVAISGDTIVVGAHHERSSATGVDGDQSDNSLSTAGAAYVFVRDGDTWVQQAYLKASNTDNGRFGSSVAISGDTIVVGAWLEDSGATGINGDQSDNSAPGSGAVYVFVRAGTTWSQQAYLKASNTDEGDRFGESVAISGDTIVVGAWREDSGATGINGNQSFNGASDSGAAYVFVRDGTTWSQQAYLKASNTDSEDYFGRSVAISGDTIVVNARYESSSATGINGNQSDNSALASGAVYVFTRAGTTWSQQAYLKASNTDEWDRFGNVAISGDTIVVAASAEDSSAITVDGDQTNNNTTGGSGAAYMFTRDGMTWSQTHYLKAINASKEDYFGVAVAISGDTIVVGAYGEDSSATGFNGDPTDNSVGDSGAVHVFSPTNNLLTNHAFNHHLQAWRFWGDMTRDWDGYALAWHRRWWLIPVAFQIIERPLPVDTVLEATVDVTNNSAVRKTVMLKVRNTDYSQQMACAVTLDPAQSTTINLLDTTGSAWQRIYYTVQTFDRDDLPSITVDNALLRIRADLTLTEPSCSGGDAVTDVNYLLNGDFSFAGWRYWQRWHDIVADLSNEELSVYIPDGGGGADAIFNRVYQHFQSSTHLELSMDVTNNSGSTKGINTLLREELWSQHTNCNFDINAGSTHHVTVRLTTNTTWGSALVSLRPLQADGVPLVIDNVSLKPVAASGDTCSNAVISSSILSLNAISAPPYISGETAQFTLSGAPDDALVTMDCDADGIFESDGLACPVMSETVTAQVRAADGAVLGTSALNLEVMSITETLAYLETEFASSELNAIATNEAPITFDALFALSQQTSDPALASWLNRLAYAVGQ